MMIKSNPPLPLSFRSELVKRLLPDLRAGECCSLIGTSGTGKSNFARFLGRLDVQEHYGSDERVWIIVIDSHSLSFQEDKAEYMATELMIHHLVQEAERRNFAPDFLTWAHKLLQHPSTHVGLPMLKEVCSPLCEQYGLQLIFVFDQFDDLWQTLEVRFFLNLRSLRDQFKYQVVYLVMTRDRLPRMRQDSQTVESFWELFSAHTYGLGPYNESDAATMVERLALRAGIPVSNVPPEVVDLSGRHPALLRAIFWAFRNSPNTSLSVDNLLQVSSVCEECAKVWNTLSSAAQRLTQIIARDLPLHHPPAEVFNDLRLKEIILGEPPTLFAPVFTAYVRQKTKSDLEGVIVDIQLRQVWLDGQVLQQALAPLEFTLLEYLARHAGTVCKREDLLHALYGEAYYDKNDQRLYAILARLREALGEDARNPRYLVTHRGGGLQLLQGGLINGEE